MVDAAFSRRCLRGTAALLVCVLLLCACGRGQDAAVSTAAPSDEAASTTRAVDPATTVPSAGQTQSSDAGSAKGTPSNTQGNGAAQSGSGCTSASAPTTAAAAAQQPAAPAADTVTLTVSFQTAVDYGILNDPAFAGVLPASGYFLQNAAVEIEAGESALDVLKRTLRENNIVYSIASSSGYVRSIGGLSERDCGAQSGWLYRINGEFPNYSSKYCELQAGDVLEFLYTCSPGDVGNVPF